MISIEDAARRVLKQNNENNTTEIFIDPATIMLLCSILSAIFSAIRLWCEWRRNKKVDGNDIKEVCTIKPIWVKRRISRILYKELGKEKYEEIGGDLANSIFEAGSKSTKEELEYLYNEHQNGGKYYQNRFGQPEKEL